MSNTTYGIEDYSYDYLSEGDKASVDIMANVSDDVLNDEVVIDFIESKRLSGDTLQNLYKDALKDFVAFLRERVEYHKCDFIMDAIDGYSDEEFAKYNNGAKKPVPDKDCKPVTAAEK